MHNKNQSKAYLFAGLSILAWSSISTAFKLSLRGLTPLGLLLVSSFTASVFLAFALMLTKSGANDLFKGVGKNLAASLIPALLNPFFYYLILFEAYSRLRAQEAQALNYTWAIVLAMASIWLLKERFRLIDLVSLLISFLGVWLISSKGAFSSVRFDDPWGSLMAVFTSLIWAGYWLLNLKDKRDALTKLFYNFFLGFLFISLLVALGRGELVAQPKLLTQGLLAAVYVGIFEMGLTFLLWFKALEYTKSTAAVANLIFLTPFLSLLFIRLVLSESIHPATFAGLILIVISNLVQKGMGKKLQRNA